MALSGLNLDLELRSSAVSVNDNDLATGFVDVFLTPTRLQRMFL